MRIEHLPAQSEWAWALISLLLTTHLVEVRYLVHLREDMIRKAIVLDAVPRRIRRENGADERVEARWLIFGTHVHEGL